MPLNLRFRFAVVFAFTLLTMPAVTRGQTWKVTSRRVTPAIGTGSLLVSVSPSAMTFNLVSAKAAAGSGAISITTTWSGSTVGSSMSLYGYFASSTAALAGSASAAAIPSSAVLGQMTTGLPTGFTAFTQTNPVGGGAASLKLFTQTITGSGDGSRTDALSMTIDLTSVPQLPADTYTGTLTIQAQVI